MILGTVQLGVNYGIGNVTGKPSLKTAFSLLDTAFYNGISMLDTAAAYGDSEQIIGRYHEKTGNIFRVCTKLPVDMSDKVVFEAIQTSTESLAVSNIDICYLHRFKQCYDKKLMSDLLGAKQRGLINEIGVSIYEPKELQYIIDNFANVIDVVQLPLNILTKDLWSDALLCKGHEMFRLYARSIYLQGLLLMPVNHPKVKELHGEKCLCQLRDLALKWGTDVKSLAWDYIHYHPYIDDFLVGCETLKQLQENIQMNQNIDKDYYTKLQSCSFKTNEVILDPRRWNG